jgi:hypothetical protein
MESILKFIANFLDTIYIFVKDPTDYKKNRKNKDEED